MATTVFSEIALEYAEDRFTSIFLINADFLFLFNMDPLLNWPNFCMYKYL